MKYIPKFQQGSQINKENSYKTSTFNTKNIKERLDIGKKNIDQSSIPKTLIGEQDGMKIFEVDDNYIKTKIYADFTEGGNGYAYPNFVPMDEIWVAKDKEQKNKEAIILHELAEVAKMKKGMSYDNAHEIANKKEMKYRIKKKALGGDLTLTPRQRFATADSINYTPESRDMYGRWANPEINSKLLAQKGITYKGLNNSIIQSVAKVVPQLNKLNIPYKVNSPTILEGNQMYNGISYNQLNPLLIKQSNALAIKQEGGKINYDKTIEDIAWKYKIPPPVYKELINQESTMNPNAKSGKGAIGLSQITKGTAKLYGLDYNKLQTDSNYNLDAGAMILKDKFNDKRVEGDWKNAIGYYNAGNKWFNKAKQPGVLKESPKYFKAIFSAIDKYWRPDPTTIKEILPAVADKTNVKK